MKWFSRKAKLPKLSVIVIFHNMPREAKRTLYSLTTEYQKGISGSDYELIAVDSSSKQPLDESMVRSHGSQFHYLSVDCEHPSPCRAMNQGVARAKGEIIVCNIDGARILSPGILSKTLKAYRRFRNPFVYTLGMHLGPKVQNESLLEGYNQSVEDEMLDKTPWKQDGYRLFSVSSVALSSKEGFYSELTESNCFALYKKSYDDIGGFDEQFITRGGGLASLDMFNRAMEREDITPVMLMGEATFHQYHGGVATNVPMEEHPWRQFAKEYRAVRGKDYATVVKEPNYFGKVVPEATHLAIGEYRNRTRAPVE